jgi:hypothetical protein
MAVATSDASARVGAGALTIESSICVATTTGFSIMTKVEKPQALERIEDIIRLSDAVMVARGDLGVEIPHEDARASSTSDGFCTKESAIQSTPSSSPKARSARSFSVRSRPRSSRAGPSRTARA